MKKQLFLIALITSTNAFSQNADSTLLGQGYTSNEFMPYLQQTAQATVCPSAVLQWQGGGAFCRASVNETTENTEQYLIDQDPTDTGQGIGSARFTCTSGNWVMTTSVCKLPANANPDPYETTEPVENHNMPYTIPNDPTSTEPEPEQNITTNTPVVTTPNAGKTYCDDKNKTICTIKYGNGNWWY